MKKALFSSVFGIIAIFAISFVISIFSTTNVYAACPNQCSEGDVRVLNCDVTDFNGNKTGTGKRTQNCYKTSDNCWNWTGANCSPETCNPGRRIFGYQCEKCADGDQMNCGCPEFQYADGNGGCRVCAEGDHGNNCGCPFRQVADGGGGCRVCSDDEDYPGCMCPDGKVADGKGGCRIECRPGQYYEPPLYDFWDGECISCSLETTEHMGVSCKCPEGQVANGNDGCKTPCANDPGCSSEWATTESCYIPHGTGSITNGCSKEFVCYNSFSTGCTATSCESGYRIDDGICNSCPEGSTLVGQGVATGIGDCKCKYANSFWNGTSCTVCPLDTVPNGSGGPTGIGNCKCPSIGWYWQGASCSMCPSGSSYSGNGAPIGTTGCKCNTAGSTWNGLSCTFCTPGQQLSGGVCTPCSSGANNCGCPSGQAANGSGGCINFCPAGSSASGLGVATGTANCKCDNFGHIWNGTSCSLCATGYYRDNNACVICPAGSYCYDAQKTPCPSGYLSAAGAPSLAGCYVSCFNGTTSNGTILPTSPKAYCSVSSCNTGKCTYNATCDTGYTATGNGTATPVCSTNIYTVVFDGNSGFGAIPTTGNTASKTCTYNQDCTLSLNGFAKSGYNFAGWASTLAGANIKAVDYPNNASVRNLAFTGSVTLYAVWLRNPITCLPGTTVKCNGTVASCTECPANTVCSGGLFENNCPDCGNVPGSAGCIDCIANQMTPGCLVKPCSSLGDKSFTVSPAGSDESKDCYKNTTCSPNPLTVSSYTPITATGTEHFSLNDNTCVYTVINCAANRFKNPSVPSTCGGIGGDCSCAACPDNGLAPAGNILNGTSCYKNCPKWLPIRNMAGINSVQAKVNYNNINGIGGAYEKCTYNITCNIGYTAVDSGTATPACLANSYTVKFDINGGDSGTIAPITCKFAEPCVLPSAGFTKYDHILMSWATAPSGTSINYGTDRDAGTISEIPNDTVTLYANWHTNYKVCPLGYYNSMLVNGVNECKPLCNGCELCDNCVNPNCNPSNETCEPIICGQERPSCNYRKCRKGTYMVKQSDNSNLCVPVPEGTFNKGEGNTNYTICAVGSYNTGTGNYDDTQTGGTRRGCTVCPSGKTTIDVNTSYTPTPEYHAKAAACSGNCGFLVTSLSNTYSFLPLWWDALTNTVHSKNTSNQNLGLCAIDKCKPGTYRRDDFSCIACPPGSYSSTNNNLATCNLCPIGTAAPNSGTITCKICTGNTTTSTTGSVTCDVIGQPCTPGVGNCPPLPPQTTCNNGWIKLAGGTQCGQCPPGAISNLTNIPSGYKVTPVLYNILSFAPVTGIYNRAPALASLGNPPHTQCWYCGHGQEPNAGHNACINCPVGTYKTANMQEFDDCQPCPANASCPNTWTGPDKRAERESSENWEDTGASCNAGHTNDPTETNEISKPCGVCKNKFVNGEVAVAKYSSGCEIANCLYQGELYNLENNECVSVCGTGDATGKTFWNTNTKKCDITCDAGYIKW